MRKANSPSCKLLDGLFIMSMRINSWEFCHFFFFSKEVGKGIFFFIFCFHFLNIFCKAILHFCSFPVSIPEVLDKNGRKRQFCLDRSGLNCHFIGQQLFLIALIFGFLSETWKVYWGDEKNDMMQVYPLLPSSAHFPFSIQISVLPLVVFMLEWIHLKAAFLIFLWLAKRCFDLFQAALLSASHAENQWPRGGASKREKFILKQ